MDKADIARELRELIEQIDRGAMLEPNAEFLRVAQPGRLREILRDAVKLIEPPPLAAVLHDPPNKLKIDAIWMAISVDDEGNEGVCAAPLPGSGALSVPLIAADEARLPFIKAMATHIARHTRKQVKIIRLHNRTDEEVIEP
jgi:hypothetical protein